MKILVLWLLLIMIVFPVFVLKGQTVERLRFTPHVIRLDRTESVIFEAKISGIFSNVVFEIDGEDRQMFDDGFSGDRIPGDSIYSLTFEATEITSRLITSDVFRPFLGYCKIIDSLGTEYRINIFAEIWTEDIPLVKINQLDSTTQFASHLVNIVGTIDAYPSPDIVKPWLNRLYNFFDDDFDFVNVIILPAHRSNRFHFAVKNENDGIGLPIFDTSDLYGSSGRLKGISIFPISFFFDGAESAYQHELGHQWINFLNGTPFESSIPHWPLSDLASGVMGISVGGGQGLRFPYELIPEGENYRITSLQGEPVFNDLELYMMGLLPADSVGMHFVFEDQDQTILGGELLLGPVIEISIEDIIEIVGERIPSSENSQKQFRIATLVVSDSLLTPEEMSYYNYFSKRAELRESVFFSSGFSKGLAKPFYLSTGGRGELFTHITDSVLGFTGNKIQKLSIFHLSQNYPNPFNPSTKISFTLPKLEKAKIEIYNTLGQKIKTLLNQQMKAGQHILEFNGQNLSSGIYFYRIEAGEYMDVKKMVLLR